MQGTLFTILTLAGLIPSCWAWAESVPLTAGLKITSSAIITSGVYRLDDRGGGMVQISGRDYTVDFKGAKLRGPGIGKGIGLHITDARNVTIKNADVSGCLWGIQIERSVGVKLLDCISLAQCRPAARNRD